MKKFDSGVCFHIAFPVRDVAATVAYYRDQLGRDIGLIEKNSCIIDFWGHQAVAHASPADTPQKVTMYPRHFGVVFADEREFEAHLDRAVQKGLDFFEPHFRRFPGTPREHRTFFLTDPSNNLLEFKWYKNSEFILKAAPVDTAG